MNGLVRSATTGLREASSVVGRMACKQTRSFSSFPLLRPTTAAPKAVFRPAPVASLRFPPTSATATDLSMQSSPLDLVAPASISRHPALAGLASQMRCGPRPTMSGATRLVQKRRHGFLSRARTKNGRKMLSRRRRKGRKRLSA